MTLLDLLAPHLPVLDGHSIIFLTFFLLYSFHDKVTSVLNSCLPVLYRLNTVDKAEETQATLPAHLTLTKI